MIDSVTSLYNALKSDKEYAQEFFRLQPLADLGDSIVMTRIKRELSQRKLAKIASTKQPSISGIENATGNPTYRVMQKVAEALDCVLHIEIVPREEYIEKHYRPELQNFIEVCSEIERTNHDGNTNSNSFPYAEVPETKNVIYTTIAS